jgi:signal transduction histidine kinase
MTKDIRTMSHLLYPPLLDEVGLQSALTEYVKGFAERSGIQVSLDLPPRSSVWIATMSCHCSALSRNASPTSIAIREARPPASASSARMER